MPPTVEREVLVDAVAERVEGRLAVVVVEQRQGDAVILCRRAGGQGNGRGEREGGRGGTDPGAHGGSPPLLWRTPPERKRPPWALP